MWIRCLKNQQPGLSLHFHCHFFLHSLAHKRKKSWLQVTSRQHLMRTLCKHILYIVTLWVTALYLKNKQVDISTTFCFSETISWLCDFSDYPDHDEATAVPNSKLGCYSYHSCLRGWYDCLSWGDHCRVSWYFAEWIGRGLQKKTGREIKENWTCLKNQKCWSLLIRSKNCFQRLVVRVVVPFLWSKQCQVMY